MPRWGLTCRILFLTSVAYGSPPKGYAGLALPRCVLRPPGSSSETVDLSDLKVIIEVVEDAPAARVPCRATNGSAGFDVYASHDAELAVGRVTLVRTGLKMTSPPGTFLEIRPRSGLATRGIVMPNAPGTIDRDYPLEVKVPLTLLFGGPLTIKTGDRVAQMRLVADLPTTFVSGVVTADGDRRGGFGSTGR